LQTLADLLRRADRTARGPSPTFDRAHLLLAFTTIGGSGTIGRQALALRTGLGAGAIRTVLKKLRDDGYADANTTGCFLTSKGRRVYESTRRKISTTFIFRGSNLTVGNFQAALSATGAGKSVKSGIEQRDAAIRVGADGATTYVMKAGKFTIPGGSSDCERDFPSKAWSSLRMGLSPRNGDSVILCGAKDETTATLGALAAALTLL
jgi:hypothetical protein